MAIHHLGTVDEQTAAEVEFTFEDANGDAQVPKTVQWKLTDGSGTVVNGREWASGTPANPFSVILSGDDLVHSDGRERWLTVEITYDSTTLGDDVPQVEEAVFAVRDLLNK